MTLPKIERDDKSFALALSRAKAEEWQLECIAFGATATAPRVIDLPGYGVDIREHIARQGFPPGSYRVTLERRPGTEPQAARRSKYRLRKFGPLSTVVKVDGDGSTPTPARRPTAAASAAPAPDSTASRHRRDEIAERTAKLELLRLDIEERRLMRELAANAQPSDSAKSAQPTPWPAIVAAVAPIIERLLSSASRREEAMMRLLAERDQAPPQFMPTQEPLPQQNPIRETMETMRELMAGMRELGIGGGGDGEGGMAGTVASIVQSLTPLLKQPAAPQPTNRIATKVARPRPGDEVKLRVVQWLVSVHRAAMQDLQPEAVADELDHAFGLLPGDFRKLILEAPSLEGLISGLGRFVPPQVSNTLSAAVTTNAAVKAWLERFLAAMRSPEEADDGNDFHAEALNGSFADGPASDDE